MAAFGVNLCECGMRCNAHPEPDAVPNGEMKWDLITIITVSSAPHFFLNVYRLNQEVTTF